MLNSTGKRSTRVIIYLIACSLAFTPLAGMAQVATAEGTEAGRVVFANGSVVAVGMSGSTRDLGRRSAVFVGDTIFTDIQSSAQIRMADSALIALKELTEFSIVAYQYEEDPDTDISAIELLQGGFRTITGAIGDQNRLSYRAQIGELASIGIRGTDYEVVITLDGEVITGVYDGGTTFSNDAGFLDLGIGADYDFGIVRSANTPPEGLLVQPTQLGIVLQSVLDNDGGDDDDTVDGDSAANRDDSSTNDETRDADNNAAGADDTDRNGNASIADTATGDDRDADNSSSALSFAANSGQLSADSTSAADRNTTTSLSLAPPSSRLVADTPTTSLSNTLTRVEQETDTSALSLNPNEIRGDGSISCSTNTATCPRVENGQLVDTRSESTNGSASLAGSGDTTGNDLDTGSDVSTSLADNGGSESDSSDRTNTDSSDSAGSDNTNSVADTDPGGTDNTGSADSDGGDGSTNSSADSESTAMAGNDDTVDVDGTGDTSKDDSNTQVASSGNIFLDKLRALLAQQRAEEQNNNPSNDSTATADDNAGQDSATSGGSTSDGSTTNPAGSAGRGVTVSQPGLIAWGQWTNPVAGNVVSVTLVDNQLIKLTTSHHFVELIPTPIANLSGSHSYTTESFIGEGSAGNILNLSAGLDVNFDTGIIDNGNLQIQVADQQWFVDFNGVVTGGSVGLTPLATQLINSGGVVSDAIEASLGGAFTGNTGENFVGGFDLVDTLNPANTVDGFYTLGR